MYSNHLKTWVVLISLQSPFVLRKFLVMCQDHARKEKLAGQRRMKLLRFPSLQLSDTFGANSCGKPAGGA